MDFVLRPAPWARAGSTRRADVLSTGRRQMLFFASLTIIVLMIAFTALYVCAEFAVVSVRRTRLQQYADQGRALAVRLLPIVDNPAAIDRYIAASQVGITLTSLVLGAFGQATITPPLAQLLGTVGLGQTAAYSVATFVVLLCLTASQMVFGELLPKAVALRFPTETAIYTFLPMAWSMRLFSPLIKLLNGSGLLLLRLLGVKHSGHRHVHSPEEIDFLLRESSEGGVIAPEELQRLHSALHLGTRKVTQLMVPRDQIVAISVDARAQEVLALATESPYTRLPVYRGTLDTIVGILHTKDVLMTQIDGGRVAVRRLLRPAVYAPASTAADQLLVMFREQHSQQAVVIDEQGKVVGLVTLEDALADLFGELADEFKMRRRRRRRHDTPRATELPGAAGPTTP
jgi:putative hemolysin